MDAPKIGGSVFCPSCRWQAELCICDRLPRFELASQFVIIQHASELHRKSNTGHWVHKMLSNSVLLTHGVKEPSKRNPQMDLGGNGLRDGHPGDGHLEGRACVLYPLPGVQELAPGSAERDATFVILDGTWNQAKRMLRRVPGIKTLPLVALPPGAKSEWSIRRSPRPERLCTLETVIRVLTLVGETEAATRMKEAMALIEERLLYTRGRRGGGNRATWTP